MDGTVELIIGSWYCMTNTHFNPALYLQGGIGDTRGYSITMYLGAPLNPRKTFLIMMNPGEDIHAFLCYGMVYHVYGDSLDLDGVKKVGD